MKKNDKGVLFSSLFATALMFVGSVAYGQSGVKNQIAVSGTVSDASAPLAGVTVIVQGSAAGTITDGNGRYKISVTDKNSVLAFSYMGYVSQNQFVGERTVVDVTLVPDSKQIDEVVVVGYGTQRKVNLTGAVDMVAGEAFENRPITNVSQGLVGVIPNLNVKMLDGRPGSSPGYNVRGTTSIGQGGNALVLIDGVEGDPAMLNPGDIESVSLLKDAASASIYGARGAFGVVLITTKKAKTGKTAISYSGNFSIKSPTTVPDNIVDSYPWAKAFADAYMGWNDQGILPGAINKTLPFSQDYLDEIKRRWEDPSLPRFEIDPQTGAYKYYYSTDWYGEMYRKNFFATDQNLSVSGGSDVASFYVSGHYNGYNGLFRYNPDKYNMYNLRAKGDIQVTRWLKVENNTDFSLTKYHQPVNVGERGGIWRNIADEGHPLAPLLNPDGTLSKSAAYTVGDLYFGRNAQDTRKRVLQNKTSIVASILPEGELTLRADLTFRNIDNDQSRARIQVPYSNYKGVTGYVGSDTNDIQERTQTTQYIATNVYADWFKSLGRHNIHVLAGYNYEQSTYKNLMAMRNGVVYEDAHDINLALGQSITTKGGYEKWRVAGGFFRVNYDFDNRYLLELNGRYDGSSKFPVGSQWAFFPSASAGWRITEEPFWGVSPKAISNIKLRASIGSLGNGNINAYKFTENFEIGQSNHIIGGVIPQQTGQPNVLPAGLTWETATTGNIGLDVTALNNRLEFTGDIYRRWTSNMFTDGPTLPAVFGADVPKGNYADLRTTGFEFSVAWNDNFKLGNKPFNYGVRFTLADSQSIITKYSGNSDRLINDYYVGKKIGEIWGYGVDGLFRSDEEIKDSPSQGTWLQNNGPRVNHPGDLKFTSLDGDNIISPGKKTVEDHGDMKIIGNSEARYNYSISLSGDWNGIFASAFFQGVMHQDWYPSKESRFWGKYNRPYNQYPRWHQNNMFNADAQNFDAYLPRLVGYTSIGDNRSLTTPNNRYLQNASYIRLRNLQVGYSLPKNWASALSASAVKVYVSAENLFTWSPMYKWTRDTDVTSIYGSDGLNKQKTGPNNSGDGYNYPMLKSVSFGLNIQF